MTVPAAAQLKNRPSPLSAAASAGSLRELVSARHLSGGAD